MVHFLSTAVHVDLCCGQCNRWHSTLQYEAFLHLHFFNEDFILLQFEHFSGSRARDAFLGTLSSGAVLEASLPLGFSAGECSSLSDLPVCFLHVSL